MCFRVYKHDFFCPWFDASAISSVSIPLSAFLVYIALGFFCFDVGRYEDNHS
jgi:hypothetical protein